VQLLLELQQPLPFFLRQLGDRDPRGAGHDLGDVFGGDLCRALATLGLLVEFPLPRSDLIPKLAGPVVVLPRLRLVTLPCEPAKVLFEAAGVGVLRLRP
jgi:hypothetical protein